MFKDYITYLFLFGVLAVCLGFAVGCGSISPVSGAAETGEGGRAAGDVDASRDHQAAADVDAGGATPCQPASSPGFAINGTCEGGGPATRGCHAACTLDGAPFVGCVSGSPWAGACYASCGACGAL